MAVSATASKLLSSRQEKKMDEIKQNAYYSKYADKIAKLQKTSPEEFMERVAKVKEAKVAEKIAASHDNKDFSLPSKPKTVLEKPTTMKPKKLCDVMKTELLSDMTKEEIGTIWTEHYKQKDVLGAIIPSETFSQMKELYNVHKTFLLPLPRTNGYEFFVVQFCGNEAHFTTLINYQAFSENAPECLTLIHYTEFAESRGIVLMVGEFDKNLLTTREAQCLANQVEMYFASPSQEKRQLLETFTFHPREFKHQELISQLENIPLAGDGVAS